MVFVALKDLYDKAMNVETNAVIIWLQPMDFVQVSYFRINEDVPALWLYPRCPTAQNCSVLLLGGDDILTQGFEIESTYLGMEINHILINGSLGVTQQML